MSVLFSVQEENVRPSLGWKCEGEQEITPVLCHSIGIFVHFTEAKGQWTRYKKITSNLANNKKRIHQRI